MEPIPTDETPVLTRLTGVRAVLFDLYGTLFISASGEVGTSRESASAEALSEALAATGIEPLRPVGQSVTFLFDAIEASHATSRQAGIRYPEVDIVEIWRTVIAEFGRRGVLEDRAWERAELERLAVEYEARANSVWPMPGLRKCLGRLVEEGILMGIISNAQFYTHELFSALLGKSAENWGFDPELQYYSYQHGRAKPGSDLHEMAVRALVRRGVEPGETLYVGNDMLNDVLTAQRVGFRTALFAGDARSLQLRPDEPQLDGVSPDVVLTSLAELSENILI